MRPLLGGRVYQYELEGWNIVWESRGNYRHWCTQTHERFDRHVLVVMKNPGSLRGDGTDLRRDTTLRILRDVGRETKCSWHIVNLFDFAAARSDELYSNWSRRDGRALVYRKIRTRNFCGVLFAHGDSPKDFQTAYQKRIAFVRTTFKALPEIQIPTTKAGNPVHPMNWQRNGLVSCVRQSIRGHFSSGSVASRIKPTRSPDGEH